MANRRMFSKKITNSSEFLMMSQSAQSLYFHLGMNADDDGICEAFTIMRMTESKPDDLTILHEKGFVYVVNSKVLIIKDWHENNLIRLDRYEKSRYLKDKGVEEVYNTIMPKQLGKGMVNQRLTEDRIGKDSIEEKASSFKKNKPFYKVSGEEMRFAQNKWWVIPKNGGEWLEFAGSPKNDIVYK